MPWTQKYLQVLEQQGEYDNVAVTLSDLSVTGDINLNQRKGKIMQIYDIAITLKFNGALV